MRQTTTFLLTLSLESLLLSIDASDLDWHYERRSRARGRDDAASWCNGNGYHELASCNSASKCNDLVTWSATRTSGDYWIGLRKSGLTWLFDDGSPYPGDSNFPWCSGYPDYGANSCVRNDGGCFKNGNCGGSDENYHLNRWICNVGPPTDAPSPSPTPAPTPSPTPSPTPAPTASPTDEPSPAPTQSPTSLPTNSPTYPQCDDAVLTVNWDNLLYEDEPSIATTLFAADANASMFWSTTAAGTDGADGAGGMDLIENEVHASLEVSEGVYDEVLGVFAINVSVFADYKAIGVYPSLFETIDNGKLEILQFGFTYVLDTFLFGSSVYGEDTRQYLRNANGCENRKYESFINDATGEDVLFAEYWNYSNSPSDPNVLTNDKYLSWPDANGWDLQMVDSVGEPCGQVEWKRELTVYDLVNRCGGFEWIDNDVDATLDLSGGFYLTALSPNMQDYNPFLDKGSYLTQIVAEQEVKLSFIKASALNSDQYLRVTNGSNGNNQDVNYFGCSLVDIEVDIENGKVLVKMLTNVPRWMKLTADGDENNNNKKRLLQPTQTDVMDIGGDYESLQVNATSGADCYLLDAFRCWQMWEISFEIDANEAENASTVGVSSHYTLQTEWSCAESSGSDDESANFCANFEDAYESKVITMDPQQVEYTISSNTNSNDNDNGNFTIEDTVDSHLTFYYDNLFENVRNIKTDPVQPFDTVFLQMRFESVATGFLTSTESLRRLADDMTAIDSIDIKSIYLCYGMVSNDTIAMYGANYASDYCLEQDSSLFEISILFDLVNDDFFNSSFYSISSDFFEFSFTMANISNLIDDVSNFHVTANVIVSLSNGENVNVYVSNVRRLVPSIAPTVMPTRNPAYTMPPSSYPTNGPSSRPSYSPTNTPTTLPTIFLISSTQDLINNGQNSEKKDEESEIISGLSDTVSILIIVLSCVFACCLLLLICFLCCRRKSKGGKRFKGKKYENPNKMDDEDGDDPVHAIEPVVEAQGSSVSPQSIEMMAATAGGPKEGGHVRTGSQSSVGDLEHYRVTSAQMSIGELSVITPPAGSFEDNEFKNEVLETNNGAAGAKGEATAHDDESGSTIYAMQVDDNIAPPDPVAARNVKNSNNNNNNDNYSNEAADDDAVITQNPFELALREAEVDGNEQDMHTFAADDPALDLLMKN